MYINTGYLNHSHLDFKDKSRPLVVGSCGIYRLSGEDADLPPKGTPGLSDNLYRIRTWTFSFR